MLRIAICDDEEKILFRTLPIPCRKHAVIIGKELCWKHRRWTEYLLGGTDL